MVSCTSALRNASVVRINLLTLIVIAERSEESRLFKYMRPFTSFRVTGKKSLPVSCYVKKRWTCTHSLVRAICRRRFATIPPDAMRGRRARSAHTRVSRPARAVAVGVRCRATSSSIFSRPVLRSSLSCFEASSSTLKMPGQVPPGGPLWRQPPSQCLNSRFETCRRLPVADCRRNARQVVMKLREMIQRVDEADEAGPIVPRSVVSSGSDSRKCSICWTASSGGSYVTDSPASRRRIASTAPCATSRVARQAASSATSPPASTRVGSRRLTADSLPIPEIRTMSRAK